MKSNIERIRIADCPVDCYSMETAVNELCQRIDSSIRTHVIFINALKIVQYHKNCALRSVVEQADLLLADGVPILWAARLKKTPLPSRVAGVDLMERMVAIAAERGYRVFLLGARPEVVSKVVTRFQEKHPNLQVAGYHHGYFDISEEKDIVAQINESKADLLLIGMSTPQKELWADRNLPRLKISVCEGVGGGFDIVAGLTRRAPAWMQRSGLEWFYRLLQEPGRMWKRYAVWNTMFLWLIFRDICKSLVKVDVNEAKSEPD